MTKVIFLAEWAGIRNFLNFLLLFVSRQKVKEENKNNLLN